VNAPKDTSPSAALERWRDEVSAAAGAILDSLADGGDDHRLRALETLWKLTDELRAVSEKVRVVEVAPDWKPRHKSRAIFKAHEKRRAA